MSIMDDDDLDQLISVEATRLGCCNSIGKTEAVLNALVEDVTYEGKMGGLVTVVVDFPDSCQLNSQHALSG